MHERTMKIEQRMDKIAMETAVEDILVKIGKPAIPHLIDCITDDSLSAFSSRILPYMELEDSHIHQLIEILHNEKKEPIQRYIILLFGEIQDERAIPILSKKL